MVEAEAIIIIIYMPIPAKTFSPQICLPAFWSLVLVLPPLLILLHLTHWRVYLLPVIYLTASHIYC